MRGGFLPTRDQRTGTVSVREVWACTDFPLTGSSYDLSWQAVEGSVPRAFGVAHPDPDLSSAVCIGKRRVYGPIRGVCKVVVDYSSALRFGGGFRNGVSVNRGTPQIMKLPIYTATVDGLVLREDPDLQPIYRRPTLVRVTERLADGSVDDLTYQIASQCWGKGYVFKTNPYVPEADGIPYVLADFQIRALPTGGTMVRYYHETLARVKAIPLGTYQGQDVALPALNFLEQYGPVKYGTPSTISAELPPIEPGAALP